MKIQSCEFLHQALNQSLPNIISRLIEKLEGDDYVNAISNEAHSRLEEGWEKWGGKFWDDHPDMNLLSQDTLEELADAVNYTLMELINESNGNESIYMPSQEV